jgi:hypothetical protein
MRAICPEIALLGQMQQAGEGCRAGCGCSAGSVLAFVERGFDL